MIIPVILAGGSGTRLWPLSRELYPKQLIDLYNEKTMLQNTLLRLTGVEAMGPPIVVCNQDHRFMTAEQLRQIRIDPHAIILEPVGRNTAPAIALAALKAMENQTDPILLVLPADHVIENKANFHAAIQNGLEYAKQGGLITFGIIPDSPETGYGYIKKGDLLEPDTGAFEVDKFVEKPDLETAGRYVDSGSYCWNSGMFMFRASAIIAELEAHAPDIMIPCREVMASGRQDLDFFRLSLDGFKTIPSDSIDYAVMERLVAAPAEGSDTPETPAEEVLFAALEKLFPGQLIRRELDFFSDLGGHSLFAARITSTLRQDPRFAQATVADIYNHRRIGLIAEALQAGMVGAEAAAERPFVLHSAWRRWRCGIAQGLAIPFLVLLTMAQWLARQGALKVFITATNVRTGRGEVFSGGGRDEPGRT